MADIAYFCREIERLRRCKVMIINTAFRPASQDILMQLLREPGQFDDGAKDEAEPLALAWFTDEEARKKVCQILRRFKLDEFAVEAEAIRRSSSDLEMLDRMLASFEMRRNKALRGVAEYRGGLARQLRERADRLIDAKDVRRLEHAPGKKSAAA